MDREMSQLMRRIRQRGQVAEMVIEMLATLTDDEKAIVQPWVRFYEERVTRFWTLGQERFPIYQLGDTTIKRLITESGARNTWRYWIRNGEDRRDYYGDSSTRSVYCIILEEAEYRGFLNPDQIVWKGIRDNPRTVIDHVYSWFLPSCDGGRHEFTVIKDNNQTCIHCRKSVTREEILTRARSMLRGRLRLTTC